jgi:hypothetical protein
MTPGMTLQPPSGGPLSAEEIVEELRAVIARGAASARAQLGVSDSDRHGAKDAIRPGTEGEAGRGAEGGIGQGGEEDATRPGTCGEERTDGAAMDRPVGQVERTSPVPEPTEVRDEGAMVVESVVQPVPRPAPEVVPVVEMPPEDEPEVRVLGKSEDPDFQIQATLECAFQLNKTMDFEISRVSALPRDSSISDLICVSFAYTFHPQRLRQISRDKSTELAQQYSEVQWLEQQNTTLIERLGEANTLVSDLGAQDRARKEELARAIEERDA